VLTLPPSPPPCPPPSQRNGATRRLYFLLSILSPVRMFFLSLPAFPFLPSSRTPHECVLPPEISGGTQCCGEKEPREKPPCTFGRHAVYTCRSSVFVFSFLADKLQIPPSPRGSFLFKINFRWQDQGFDLLKKFEKKEDENGERKKEKGQAGEEVEY
jgi:hypothetical protein